MPCYHPINAYQVEDGSVVFNTPLAGSLGIVKELKLPCGSCIGCRMERARQWAVRCTHEASLYERNCFITLTYNDAHLPDGNDLLYRDFQLFMKRLRKKCCYYLPSSKHQGPYIKVRFFMCGEYGEDYGRPHFHACLFNLDFDDRIYFKTTASGSKVYTSETLASLWLDSDGDSIGYSTVGDVNFNSAGYVARYVFKKTGSGDHYDIIDRETGVVEKRNKEFVRMSLKPGIGSGFFHKWKSDMFPNDYVVLNGKKMKPPRYYTKLLDKFDGDMYDWLQYKRELEARPRLSDNSADRLEVKEVVAEAKVKLLKRELN